MGQPLPLPVGALSLGVLAILALSLAVLAPMDVVLYNHSPSVPPGFYIRADARITRGMLVTVRAAEIAPDLARLHDFTDPGDRFVKRVAATAGDEVCADGATVSVNARIVARRRTRDAVGRTLPSWSGCRVLSADDVLLLGDSDDSFDGRYWGLTRREQIEGVWRRLSL